MVATAGVTSEDVPRRPWLSRTLIVLTVVSLTQDLASELLYPLLPLFLTGVLAAPPVVLGLVEGLAEATAGVTKYIAGRWSDRRRRRPFVAAGYGLAAAGKAVVAAATMWPVVLVGRVLDRFGKGVRSAPRDALIAASVPPAARGRAFGFHRMGDSLGAVFGPLLGLAALALMHHHLRSAMWWAVVPAALSALLVVFVREPVRQVAAALRPADGVAATSVLPAAYWRVVAVLVVIAVVNFSDALLLLRLIDLGFSTTQVVGVYVVFNAVYTLGSYPAGVLADRWRPASVYAVGLAAFGTAYLGLSRVHGGWPVVVLFAVYGLFPALTDGVGKAWISRLVPGEHLGRGQGIFQGGLSLAVLLAGLWAGLAWSAGTGNGVVPLTIAGLTGLVASAGLAMAGRGGRFVPSTAPG